MPPKREHPSKYKSGGPLARSRHTKEDNSVKRNSIELAAPLGLEAPQCCAIGGTAYESLPQLFVQLRSFDKEPPKN